jgi:hypothetical protein
LVASTTEPLNHNQLGGDEMLIAGELGRGINEAFRQVAKATSGLSSGTFTVNQENVLAAARIIDTAADDLFRLLRESKRNVRIDPPGGDEVSTRMSRAWNDRLLDDEDSYAERVGEYVLGLRKLAVQLGDTAKAYGYSEEQIEAAFRAQSA